MFELPIYSLIAGHSVPLRVMEQVFGSAQFAGLNPAAASISTRFTSIRNRIDTINADYFEQLFNFCVSRFSRQLTGDKNKNKPW